MQMQDTDLVADLCRRFNAGEPMKYVFFWGHQPAKHGVTVSCFSQWYHAPFVVNGQHYPTAEHFMMAEKAALFDDQSSRRKILEAPDPAAAKALGRQVRGFNDARWTERRFEIVVAANQAKFAQNAELAAFLKQTGSKVLVEASPVDRVWGVGLAATDEKIQNPNRWRGLNLLGFALMQVRDALP